jgi:hypothetical protein
MAASVTIPLTRGLVAVLDSDDLALAISYTWCAVRGRNTYYAQTRLSGGKTIFMHRMLVDASKCQEVDHRDGDGLNNRRTNLRVCTPAQNRHNTQGREDSSSCYKGVSWNKNARRWHAQIKHGSSRLHLGYYVDEWAAALAYNTAALRFFGEYAWLNQEGGKARVLPNPKHAAQSKNAPSRTSRRNTSGYRGVTRTSNSTSKWIARIKINGKSYSLGCFISKHAAARAYNMAALSAWGNSAIFNDVYEDDN